MKFEKGLNIFDIKKAGDAGFFKESYETIFIYLLLLLSLLFLQ